MMQNRQKIRGSQAYLIPDTCMCPCTPQISSTSQTSTVLQASTLLAGASSPAQPSAAKAELDEQTKKYAEVVRSVNRALVGGSSQQLDVTQSFLAACPEDANGRLPNKIPSSSISPLDSSKCSRLLDGPVPTQLTVIMLKRSLTCLHSATQSVAAHS